MRAALTLVVAIFPVVGLSQTVLSTTPVGPIPSTNGSQYYLSPDGKHVAVVKSSGSRRVVSIDGKDGEVFDSIEPIIMERVAGHANQILVVFSPDGSRHAYGARRGDEYFVIIDGKAYPGNPSAPNSFANAAFAFSPDSKRFAYVAATGQPENAMAIVVDGEVGKPVDVINDLMFSDDSRRVAYHSYSDGVWSVVVDGKYTVVPEKVFYLQFKGGRVAYVVATKNGLVPVIDGVPQNDAVTPASGLPEFKFSDDGRHWAFTTSTPSSTGSPAFRVFHDGKAGEVCLSARELQFSPDGKHYGYIAGHGNNSRAARMVVVMDGKRVGLEYNNISKLQLSRDGKHFAALATSDAGAFVIVDGNESEALMSPPDDFELGATGRFVYSGRPKVEDGTHIYVDGKDLGRFDELTKKTVAFSPDGTRLVFGSVKRYPQNLTYIDGELIEGGIESNSGLSWKRGAIFSADSRHVAFVSGHSQTANLYVDSRPGIAGYLYAMPVFSADGKHFAVAGRPGQSRTWTAFLDGKAIATFDDLMLTAPETWQFTPDGKLHIVAIANKQIQKVVADPQGSTLDSFTANMSKSGKTGNAIAAGKSAAPSQAGAVAKGDTVAVPDPESEADAKADEAGNKVKSSVDKGVSKLKGLLGGKDKDKKKH